MGVVLAIALLGLLAAGLWWAWRRPFIGLGLLVAGMAFHSFVLMVMLRLGTPYILVRAVQGWKEIIIVLLTAVALLRIWRVQKGGRAGPLLLSDWVAIGFAVIATVYFLLPESILHSGTSLTQRLVGYRVIGLIPLIYFLARRLEPVTESELRTVLWLCMGAGAVVSLFGVFELFFVPTRTWIDWGVNLYTNFLGFSYNGPGGLPPNFFVTLPDGTLLRRVVSTYISPLGVAYTGLLLFPLGVVLIDRQRPGTRAKWFAIAALTLVVIGVMFAVTRLALFALVGEAALLSLLLRRAWIATLVPVVIAASILMLYPYASLGPAVDRNLVEVKRTHWQWAISGNDSSAHGALRVPGGRYQVRPPAPVRSRDRRLRHPIRPAGRDRRKRCAWDVRGPGCPRRRVVRRLLSAGPLEWLPCVSVGARGLPGGSAAAHSPGRRPRPAPDHRHE